MVKEAKAFMSAVAGGMRVTYIDPRASLTACKAHRYWQVRPNSDYGAQPRLIHEVLKQDAYDKDFVTRFVTGMDARARRSRNDAGVAGSRIPGLPPRSLRAFVKEIAAARPRVLFTRLVHGASQAVVSRDAHGTDPQRTDGKHREPGGYVLAKMPEQYGRKSLKRLAARAPKLTEPRVDGAGSTRPQWDPATARCTSCLPRSRAASPTAWARTLPTATIR